MKNLRPLTEFENVEECDRELKAVFHELFPDPSAIKMFWLFLDKTDGFECVCPNFFERIPKTVAEFKKMGLTMKHCYMISIVDYAHGSVHVDYRADPVRIHWPVLNEDSVITKWFNFDGNLKDCPVKIVDKLGPPYVEVDAAKCTLIDEHVFKGPTAFRVDIPHSAEAVLGALLPRVAFSFTFKEQEQVNLLLS
jgi:hypothetical protein